MPSPRVLSAALVAFLAALACGLPGTGGTAVKSSPAPAAPACVAGDHSLEEAVQGWGFCYPGTWRFLERVQASQSPAGADTTFDITEDGPPGDPSRGLFGFMIVSTYPRGASQNLAQWLAANEGPGLATQDILWGNALEAVYVPSLNQRYALTPHQVVALTLKQGVQNLDLEAAMGPRLATWRFSY